MLNFNMRRVDVSMVYLCAMISLGAAQVNVIKRYFVATNEKRIIPSYTTIIKQISMI